MSDLKNEKFFRKYNTNELIDKDKGFLILEIFKAICIPVFFLLFITCLACGLYISAILCLLCMLANFPIKIYSKILKNEKFDKFFEKIELSWLQIFFIHSESASKIIIDEYIDKYVIGQEDAKKLCAEGLNVFVAYLR